MTERDVADVFAALFDPLLAIEERAEVLKEHEVVSAVGFDQAGLLTMNEGVVLRFADGSAFQVVIIQCDR